MSWGENIRPAVGAKRSQRNVSLAKLLGVKERRGPFWGTIPTKQRVKSFADDLNIWRGIVGSKLILLSWFNEIQLHIISIR
jgi:hypothetical protein